VDRNLDAFLTVARTKNLTQASNLLGVTQPSVTKRIANLEAEFGAALFERHRRGMALTTAGRFFYERAKRIEVEYKQSREEITALTSAGLSVLRVCAGPLFRLRFVAELFKTLKLQFPNLQLELSTEVLSPKIQALNDSEIDVYMGIITSDELHDSIFVKYVTQVEHGIVVRAEDPHARMAKIDPALLASYNWVIFSIDPENERSIRDYWVPKAAITRAIDVHTTSFATGLELVRQGNFVMSAPLQLAPIIEREGLVIRPTLQGMPRRQAGIHLRKSALGYAAIQSLLDFFGDEDLSAQSPEPTALLTASQSGTV
jgi:DNA-binding transcriptional LysR family regulator